jgi:hypothetical protein
MAGILNGIIMCEFYWKLIIYCCGKNRLFACNGMMIQGQLWICFSHPVNKNPGWRADSHNCSFPCICRIEGLVSVYCAFLYLYSFIG